MGDVFVVGAKRTPHGKFGKSLSTIPASVLGGMAIKSAITHSKLDKRDVEEVIFGNVIQAGNGQNIAGQCAFHSGLPSSVVKNTVNVVCASGMLAIENGCREIALGERDVVVAGGVESMSRAPYLMSYRFRQGVKNMFSDREQLEDAMYNDGLRDAFYDNAMGYWADKTAIKFSQNRKDVDEYALQSFERAFVAKSKGLFNAEIADIDALKFDEGIRETTLESLERLKPAFTDSGVHTAGNSSQISDGASALVLVSKKYMEAHDLKPLATIKDFASASVDSRDFLEAPIKSSRELIQKHNWKIEDFDIVEHNEAFSGGCLLLRDQLGIDNEKFNVNGGAIAIGHPLGSSGSRIVVTLIHALKYEKKQKGLATLCHGGGGGHSMAIEVTE
jgi:acetyl-CoA acetyltransferases